MPVPLRIAYITAGAAGMYCGSCMHDNTLARALGKLGVDVQLIPLYTPIRTDEENVSLDRVFFGGVNVYLQQKIPLFRYLPEFVDRFFDQPWLLKMATSRTMEMKPQELGRLTLSMLRGESGQQRKEVRKLCHWLKEQRPSLIVLTNLLVAGCAPALVRELSVPIAATVQGDDVFLDTLVEPYKSQCLEQIRRITADVSVLLAHSRFYADYMSSYFDVPREKFQIAPLGIDLHDFSGIEQKNREEKRTSVGYLARLAPEKGLHLLVEAFIQLKQRPHMEQVRLEIAGWLGGSQKAYVEEQFARLKQAGLENHFRYHGSIDRQGKVEFLRSLDLFSVPTTFQEPKGLFVLEALAAGIPVVQPNHGAFPELLAATKGGVLVPPGNSAALASALEELLLNTSQRELLSRQGRQAVHENHHAEKMARDTLSLFQSFLSDS